jgi:hypothetical protein
MRLIKSRKMCLTGHVALMEERINAYKPLIGKHTWETKAEMGI